MPEATPRTCGKIRHFTYASADAHAGQLRRDGKDKGKPGWLRPYLCPRCGHWHVGHGRPKEVARG